MIRFQPMVLLCVVFCCGLSNARAAQNELQSLLSAQNLDELRIRESGERELERASENCSAELKARALPRSCFLEIKLQNRSPVAAALDRQRIDRVCRDIAAHSQSRLDLGGSTDLLTNGCREVVAKRNDDLRYTDEEAHPELSASRTLGPDFEE